MQASFLYALARDFEEHGADAIRNCRTEEPSRYVQIIASLMPRELEIEHGMSADLTDEELDRMIINLRAELSAEKPLPLIEAKLIKVEDQ